MTATLDNPVIELDQQLIEELEHEPACECVPQKFFIGIGWIPIEGKCQNPAAYYLTVHDALPCEEYQIYMCEHHYRDYQTNQESKCPICKTIRFRNIVKL